MSFSRKQLIGYFLENDKYNWAECIVFIVCYCLNGNSIFWCTFPSFLQLFFRVQKTFTFDVEQQTTLSNDSLIVSSRSTALRPLPSRCKRFHCSIKKNYILPFFPEDMTGKKATKHAMTIPEQEGFDCALLELTLRNDV